MYTTTRVQILDNIFYIFLLCARNYIIGMNPIILRLNSVSVSVSTYTHTHTHTNTRGRFNKFPDIFVQAFKIGVDSWKCSMLFLYILWDDWPILMISGSNEQLQ